MKIDNRLFGLFWYAHVWAVISLSVVRSPEYFLHVTFVQLFWFENTGWSESPVTDFKTALTRLILDLQMPNWTQNDR